MSRRRRKLPIELASDIGAAASDLSTYHDGAVLAALTFLGKANPDTFAWLRCILNEWAKVRQPVAAHLETKGKD